MSENNTNEFTMMEESTTNEVAEQKKFNMPDVTVEGVGLLVGVAAAGAGIGVGITKMVQKHRAKKAAASSEEKKPGLFKKVANKMPFTLKKKQKDPEIVDAEVVAEAKEDPKETSKK